MAGVTRSTRDGRESTRDTRFSVCRLTGLWATPASCLTAYIRRRRSYYPGAGGSTHRSSRAGRGALDPSRRWSATALDRLIGRVYQPPAPGIQGVALRAANDTLARLLVAAVRHAGVEAESDWWNGVEFVAAADVPAEPRISDARL